jgi:hypothetical protein
MSHFEEVERLLSRLNEASAEVLSIEELSEVQHFVDVGEYGLALETAVGIYVEERKPVPAEVRELMRRLAEMMEMNAVLSRLQT